MVFFRERLRHFHRSGDLIVYLHRPRTSTYRHLSSLTFQIFTQQQEIYFVTILLNNGDIGLQVGGNIPHTPSSGLRFELRDSPRISHSRVRARARVREGPLGAIFSRAGARIPLFARLTCLIDLNLRGVLSPHIKKHTCSALMNAYLIMLLQIKNRQNIFLLP